MTVTFTSRIGLDSVGPAGGELILLFDEMQKAVRARDIAELLVGAFQSHELPEHGQLYQGWYEAEVELLIMSLSRVLVSHRRALSFDKFCAMVSTHSDEFAALAKAEPSSCVNSIAGMAEADANWLKSSTEVAKLKAVRNQWLAHIEGGRVGVIPINPLAGEELDLLIEQTMERLNRYALLLGKEAENFAEIRKEIRSEFQRLVSRMKDRPDSI